MMFKHTENNGTELSQRKLSIKKEKVYNMSFAKIYPLLVNKATRKGRTVGEIKKFIGWLTGYSVEEIEQAAKVSGDGENRT